jgi:MSHA biogenesis protein MshI
MMGPEQAAELQSLASRLAYSGMPATIVLHPSLYRIYFVERPNVPDEDVGDAVKWQIKDQVEKPLAELLVDAFSVPDDAFRGSTRMVYAVAAERLLVQNAVDWVTATGMKVDTVQIAELAMRNIMSLMDTEQGSIALLRLRNTSGTILLSQAGSIYLARQIETGLSMIDGVEESVQARMLDDMLLDIQRSLDYFESQLRKGVVRNFYVAPTRQLMDVQVHEYLQQQLNVNVSGLDLADLFEADDTFTIDLQGQCFAAIGAALGEAGN